MSNKPMLCGLISVAVKTHTKHTKMITKVTI